MREPGYPVMYGNHGRYNSQELYNTELKRQRDKEKKDKLKRGTQYQDLRGCRKGLCRIAVARADVVSQDILALHACDGQ